MAENDPNGWAKAPGFNTWGHVGVAKENAFYQLLDETKEKTDAIFEVVNLTFALVNSALDFIASLLIDFTNPLKPIIEEIIALLESFISDLRNLGWYVTWDKKEFGKNPVESLLGGYPAFETRMIEKLLNLKDPTRPNFSPQSKVFAMTFFAGADASKLGAIIAYMKKLLKLFLSFKGESDKAAAPINVRVGYYNDLVGDIEIPSVYKPDGIRVKWNLPAPPSTNKIFPKTFILPDYFLFSVATRNTNEKIATLRKVPRQPTETLQISLFGPDKPEFQDLVGGITDPRLWPLIKTDEEFTKINENEVITARDLIISPPNGTGTTGSFILKGDDTLYINKIDERKISDVYRCFIYGGGGGGLVGDNDFSFDIPLENLKINDELVSEYYITMYSLTIDSDDYKSTSKTIKELPGLLRTGTQALLEEGGFLEARSAGVGSYTLAMSNGSISKPSAIVTVKSPSDIREKYLKAVKFYWLAHLLTHPYEPYHLNILGFDSPVGKEQQLISFYYESNADLYVGNQTIKEFALKANEWLKKIMLRFKSDMPSDTTLNSLKDSLDKINEFPLDLAKMMKDTATGGRVGIQPTSIYINEDRDVTTDMLNSNNYDLELYERIGESVVHDRWVGSKSPVVIDHGVFVGHLFLHKDFKETFRLAQRVVTLSPPLTTETGAWINQRPFRDSDLSSLTNFIDTVKKYMEGFLKGLEGIVSQILKFIHMLKTRIAQVQAIIAKIKTLIDLILSFRFPAGLYGTFHLADGTAGLISALQQSEDKPDIGSSGYGTGAMVVAGGVPTILIDFFIALMGGEGEG